MKRTLLALMLLAAFASQAQTTTNSYLQSVGGGIPDGNSNGTNSTLTVSGIIGTIQDITVSLNISNGWNGDLYAYLLDPSGNFAVLLNRVGADTNNFFGYGDGGLDVTFTLGATNIHYYQDYSYSLNTGGQLTGTWAVDGRNVDPTNMVGLSTAPATATLDSFLGANPNGDWSLFIADVSNEYTSYWDSWGITIVTVPEPTTISLLAVGAVTAGILFRNKNRKNGRR